MPDPAKKYLPYGWEERFSSRHGHRKYYFNIYTGASSWKQPPLLTKKELKKQRFKVEKDLHKKKAYGQLPRQQKSLEERKKHVKKSKTKTIDVDLPDSDYSAPSPPAEGSPGKFDTSTDSELQIDETRPTQSHTISSTVQDPSQVQTTPVLDQTAGVSHLLGTTPSTVISPTDVIMASPFDATSPAISSTVKTPQPVPCAVPPPSTASASSATSVPMTDSNHSKPLTTLSDVNALNKSTNSSLYSPSATDDAASADDDEDCKLVVVVDTNVLLKDLSYISDLKDTTLPGFGKPTIVVPWICFQELDGLKRGDFSTADCSKKAATFLNSCFQKGHPRMKAQSQQEDIDNTSLIQITCADDKVLNCCLQQKKLLGANQTLLLFTNDINLSNKALVNGIKPVKKADLESSGNIHSALHSMDTSISSIPSVTAIDTGDEILGEVKFILRDCLSVVIETEMEQAYRSDLWKQIVARKPPWSVEDIFFNLDKHWVAVFRKNIKYDAHKHVISLLRIFRDGSDIGLPIRQVWAILIDAAAFLDYLVDNKSYGDMIRNSLIKLKDLQAIAQKVAEGRMKPNKLSILRDHLLVESRERRLSRQSKPDAQQQSVSTAEATEETKKAQEIVLGWFQAVWETANDICANIRRDMNVHFKRLETTKQLEKVQPIVRTLRGTLGKLIGTPVEGLDCNDEIPTVFSAMCWQLNNFFINVNNPRKKPGIAPIRPKQLVQFYLKSEQNREILRNGVDQADEFMSILTKAGIALSQWSNPNQHAAYSGSSYSGLHQHLPNNHY